MVEYVLKPRDCGKISRSGDVIKLHYNWTLENGTLMDSTYQRNEPLQFTVGKLNFVKAWEGNDFQYFLSFVQYKKALKARASLECDAKAFIIT